MCGNSDRMHRRTSLSFQPSLPFLTFHGDHNFDLLNVAAHGQQNSNDLRGSYLPPVYSASHNFWLKWWINHLLIVTGEIIW